MLKTGMRIALLSGIVLGGAFAPAGAFPDSERIERLERDEARGGPRIEGGRSPFQTRYKICNEPPTPAYQRGTSRWVKVMKTACWFEQT